MMKMRRTNKMTKRMLALALSLSMVFGLTFTVYAEEESSSEHTEAAASEHSESSESSGSSHSENGSQSQQSESSPVQEAVSTSTDAGEKVETAQAIVAELTVAPEILNELQNELGLAAKDITNVTNELGDPALTGYTDAAAATNQLVVEGSDILNDTEKGVDAELNTFDTEAKATTDDAQSAIDNAKKANKIGDKDKAVKAKNDAEADLGSAEKELVKAQDAYQAAEDAKNEAQAKYDLAVEEQKKAEAKVEVAKEALERAEGNATAALEQLKAAQANAKLLKDKVEQYGDTKEDLEKIQKQYRAMMVYYYRNLGCEVLDSEGNVDLDKSAAAALELTKNGVDAKANNPDKAVMQMSRDLMAQLVEYMVKNKENYVGDYKFAVEFDGKEGEKKQVKDANKGELYTRYDEDLDMNVEDSKLGKSAKQTWANVDGDNGRNNHVKVTYTITVIEDGQEVEKQVTEYYNYLFKNSAQYHDDLDIENGPIYLALVSQKDGKWTNEAVQDADNFDDYNKLLDAINAFEDIEKYEAAKKAVDEAEKKVEELQSQIEELKNVSVDTGKLEALKSELEAAEDALSDASEAKDAMEAKVEEARKAVAAIDLSRFKVDPADDDAPASPTPTPDSPAVIVTPVIPEIVPVVTIGSTPALANFAPVAFEDAAPAEEVAVDAVPVLTLEDEELPAAAEPVTLEENELPAAHTIDEEASLWWLWILLLFVTIVVVYGVYRYNEQKKANEKAE